MNFLCMFVCWTWIFFLNLAIIILRKISRQKTYEWEYSWYYITDNIFVVNAMWKYQLLFLKCILFHFVIFHFFKYSLKIIWKKIWNCSFSIYNTYRVSGKFWQSARVYIKRSKLNQKVLYHFAIFAIVNEILIIKNRWILVYNNFVLKYYQLYRKITKDKNCLFFSLFIFLLIKFWEFFSELFQNFLISYILMLEI